MDTSRSSTVPSGMAPGRAWTALPIRLLLCAALILQLVVFPGPLPVTRADWVVVICSALILLAAARVPVLAAIGQSLVVVAAVVWSAPNAMAMAMASLAVAEVALRCGWVRAALVSVPVAAALVVKLLSGTPHDPVAVNMVRIGVVVVVPALVGLGIRRAVRRSRELQSRVAELEYRRAEELAAAREAERAALSRELHDVVAHHVASIVFSVGVARQVRLDAQPELRTLLDEVHRTSALALQNLRRLMSVLREGTASSPAMLYVDTDPHRALRHLVDDLRTSGGTATVDSSIDHIGPLETMAVLRLVDEGVRNADKHGRAGGAIDLAMAVSREAIDVSISNPVDHTARIGQGLGLTGMRERVEILGGSVTAGPSPEADRWVVDATIPVAEYAQANPPRCAR